jgi:hypothetical protein
MKNAILFSFIFILVFAIMAGIFAFFAVVMFVLRIAFFAALVSLFIYAYVKLRKTK